MDKQHLHDLLPVYRPGIDDNDPQFAELVALLRQDPELRRQLEERRAADNAIGTKLRSITPPADLKARILDEHQVVWVPPNWWRQPQWLTAAAAAVVILVGLMAFWLKTTRQDTFWAYRDEMTKFVMVEYKLDVHQTDLAELRDTFAKRGWPANAIVPDKLKPVPLEGGCLLQWRGRKVSLWRFETKDQGGLWLFVVDRTSIPDTPTLDTLLYKRSGKIVTASWSQGDFTYILATEGDQTRLLRYL